jgi:hypothetical protein
VEQELRDEYRGEEPEIKIRQKIDHRISRFQKEHKYK